MTWGVMLFFKGLTILNDDNYCPPINTGLFMCYNSITIVILYPKRVTLNIVWSPGSSCMWQTIFPGKKHKKWGLEGKVHQTLAAARLGGSFSIFGGKPLEKLTTGAAFSSPTLPLLSSSGHGLGRVNFDNNSGLG